MVIVIIAAFIAIINTILFSIEQFCDFVTMGLFIIRKVDLQCKMIWLNKLSVGFNISLFFF